MAAHATARVTRATARMRLRGIYLIVNESGEPTLEIARAGLSAGIGIVQYRAKRGIDNERARALRALTRERDALLILNDDWRAALEFDCDGVHLGPDDDGFRAVARVRSQIGDRLIGLSCGTVEEAVAATAAGADYAGVGSVYATASKPDAGPPIGIDGLRRITAATRLPVAAIGGIDASNLAAAAATGVAMAAVISAIAGAAQPDAAATELVAIWNREAAG